jgi:CubicO group peptidase (beta-lactamase class C family)
MGMPQRASHPQIGSRPRIFGRMVTAPAAPWVRGENTNSPLPPGSFSAVGLGGQILSIVPPLGLVIVALCDNRSGGNAQMAIPDAVVSAILGLDSVATAGVGTR